MAIPRKQIGWSNESNLLWQISSQMEKLTGVVSTSGGGGSTPGIDTVLLQAQPLSNSRIIEFNGNDLAFTSFGNLIGQFNADGSATLGDLDNVSLATKFFVEVADQRVRTTHQGNDKGIYLDFSNKSFQIGDTGNSDSGAILQVNTQVGSELIQTSINNNGTGLQINFPIQSYSLGDFGGNNNSTFINVDDGAATTRINGQNIALNDDGNNTLITSSAGGDSGNFLVITINNQQYKIQLFNP